MKTIVIFILSLITIPSIGQTYRLNKDLIERDRKDFLGCIEELFEIGGEFSFSLSVGDLYPSLDDIEHEHPSTPEYLETLKDSLSRDSLNFHLLSKIGNYYENIKEQDNANKFFNKALKNIDVHFFENDSARYFGNRSILRFKLGKDGFIEDAEKALSLNPNEMNAFSTYTLHLFSIGNYNKVKSININSLNANNPQPEVPIFSLILVNAVEKMFELRPKLDDPMVLTELKQTYYKELIDWTSIKSYYGKIKNKEVEEKIDKLTNFFNLFLKILVSNYNEKNPPVFYFNPSEIKEIKELENWLQQSFKNERLNEYTLNKCLGFINFCLDKRDLTIDYYKKAFEVFPENAPKTMFNPNEVYSNLLFMYKIFDRNSDYENLLLERINNQLLRELSDYINLIKLYSSKDQMEKVQFYMEEAEKINPNNFELLRLKAHVNFLKGTEIILEGFYLNKARRFMQNDSDNYLLFLQSAIYDIFNHKPEDAINKLNLIKENQPKCETCDRLIATYFNIENN
ncbi:hypothetical protein [Tamlana flava]|uniref:hypothetical protein n=1 Tax=Tamlana flava TaxID=3158572 RepID=UPI00351B51E4